MSEPREDAPTYILSYPRAVRLVRFATIALLTIAALARWVLAWISFVRPVIVSASSSVQAIEILTAQPLRPLVSAHLSLLLVAGAIAFVQSFLPDLALIDEGINTRTILGWSTIPWETISAVRIASLESSTRRLFLVQGHWSRWSPWPRLVSACLGAGFEPGLLLTSDIRDVVPLMGHIHQQARKANPDAVFDDQFFTLPARMVFEPTVTLQGLIEQAKDEGWPLGLSAQAMAAVASGLVLVQLFTLILFGGVWWKPMAIVGLCGLEWLIGTLYLYGLTELFPGHYEFRDGALLYPLAQIPRALLALPMIMLVAAGMPFLAGMVGLAGILWTVVLTAFLVQEMYHLKSILPTMIGGILQTLFLFIILIIVLMG